MKMRRSLVLSATCLLFNACNLSRCYGPPEVEVPCEWSSPLTEGMSEESPNMVLWWESLNDPTLTALIEQATTQNLDLKIAAMRILEARAEWKGAKYTLYPRIDGSATYSHVYYSKDALINGLLYPVAPDPDVSFDRNVDFYEVGFDAEWELDFFGLKKYEIRAIQAKIEASEHHLCDVWVSLSAEIGRNYVELRALQNRSQLINQQIQIQNQHFQLTKQLYEQGIVDAITMNETETHYFELVAQKPIIETLIDKAIHRISILVGCVPSSLYQQLCTREPLPLLPCDKPIGIPSEILRRRPDIRRAEKNFAASSHQVAVAIASYFPRISLRGFAGSISTELGKLLSPSSLTWLAGPQLLLPIFNSRLIEQDITYNKIKVKQACFEYQKTVLEALEEVENSIASFHFEMERNQALIQSLQKACETFQLKQQLFEKGIASYIEVLSSEQTLLAAQDTQTQSQMNLLFHYISLYKALGGCWEVSYLSSCDCNSTY